MVVYSLHFTRHHLILLVVIKRIYVTSVLLWWRILVTLPAITFNYQ